MSYQMFAFYTGLLASLHCVAMCGPLMLSMPFGKRTIVADFLQKTLYQLGRIFMYTLLGLIIGLMGIGFNFLGMQQVLSLATGILLVAAGMQYFFKTKFLSNNFFTHSVKILTQLLAGQLNRPGGSFLAGSLNGLLPCGMVYIALAQAVNLPTPYQSVSSMMFFGLGTTPLLLLTTLVPNAFRRLKPPSLLIPILFLVSGCFLVSRGLNLEIPYISHTIPASTAEVCK